jgi:hypothetical protein
MDPQELLSYRLARSAISITGSVTRTPFPGASERVTQASTVTLIVEGDRAGEATFGSATASQKEELAKLTAEDRLLTKLKQPHGDLDAVNSMSGDAS